MGFEWLSLMCSDTVRGISRPLLGITKQLSGCDAKRHVNGFDAREVHHLALYKESSKTN